MPLADLPIFCHYDKQRFTQFGSMDCANWYAVQASSGKKNQALYPAMGRKHINFFKKNRLIFEAEPRVLFRTIDYVYIVVNSAVFQVDKFYNEKEISIPVGGVSLTGNIWFDFLAVGTNIFGMMTDEERIYVIKESGSGVTMEVVTDPNAPLSPSYIASFGNRFVVSQARTPDFFLSTINLDGNANTYFTINNSPLFARASGVIEQMAVLHNQLYIFLDFTTDIWSNIPTQISVAGAIKEFPWKLNTSYNWDFGLADPFSLDVDFGFMTWLARNRNGLVSFMTSKGGQPEDISTQAIDVLLESSSQSDTLSPFLESASEGFLYQYENSIFYRVSAGKFLDFGLLDLEDSANALEYNFRTGTWHRVIELNGERNRIKRHIFFNRTHLVTVEGDPAVYEMAGDIYRNETRNTAQPDPQAENAFLKFPMRYEMVTPHIYEKDYSEFITDYIEIDFVFGNQSFYKSNTPFLNTVYLTDEASTDSDPIYLVDENSEDGSEIFLVASGTDTPTFDDNHYSDLFKPHVELFYSNDGGMTFLPADKREFSPLGAYRWRMRWYELGPSRNRCYKLVCVSSAPIVILGGVQNIRRSSGGSN